MNRHVKLKMTNNIQHLFFDQEINHTTTALTPEESAHCIKTLRLQKGDIIHITNGQGSLYKAIILEITKKIVHIKITNHHYEPAETLKRVHIAISQLKNKDRTDFLIEKLTEIGISSITIINYNRTIKKTIKLERLKKISIAALKQSQQLYLPEILGPYNNITEFIKHQDKQRQTYVAHCIKTSDKAPLNKLTLSRDSMLMIGPEGDFTEEELHQLKSYLNVTEISLGNTRLRSETAAITSASVILNNI